MLFQQCDAIDHAVKGRLLFFIEPVAVMNLTRSIDAHADEKIVAMEKLAPLVREIGSVGLERIADLAPVTMPGLKSSAFSKKTCPSRVARRPARQT